MNPTTFHLDWTVAGTSIAIAVIAIALATWMYAREQQPVADMLATRFSTLHRAAYKRFYMDEIWLFVTKKIIFRCVSTPLAWFDRHVIDQFMISWPGARMRPEKPYSLYRTGGYRPTRIISWQVSLS